MVSFLVFFLSLPLREVHSILVSQHLVLCAPHR